MKFVVRKNIINYFTKVIKSSLTATVVASVWGEEFIQFLPSLAVLPMAILNNRMNYTRMIRKKRMNST